MCIGVKVDAIPLEAVLAMSELNWHQHLSIFSKVLQTFFIKKCKKACFKVLSSLNLYRTALLCFSPKQSV